MVYGLIHSFQDSVMGNIKKAEKGSKIAGRKIKKGKKELAKFNRNRRYNRRVVARLPNNHVSNSGRQMKGG